MFWLILTLLVVILYYKGVRRPRGFPPGPPSLPFVGSLPFIQLLDLHKYLENARLKYGPVVGFKLGFRDCVAFCGPDQVKDAFKIDALQGRPPITIASQKAKYGIILTEGAFWSTQRRFTLRHLRDFGFGKTELESVIRDEIEDFISEKLKGTNQVQVSHLFNKSVINVLWAVMAGRRYSHDDQDFKVLLEALEATFRSGGFTNRLVFLRRYLRSLVGWDEKIECEEILCSFIENTIEQHKQTRMGNPRDFIDVYLEEIDKKENPDFNELVLTSICVDLFTAGSESVGNTIGFCILYLVLHPHWQDELCNEMNEVLGSSPVTLQDRPRLPKLEAFWSEVVRCNSIAPAAVPRRAMADVQYNGYTIPKNTFVIISIWSLLRDKQHWKDPDNFRPERFLNADGEYVKDDWLATFGIGKRQCPGESLARNVLFLFLASLVRSFEFSIPPGHSAPTTDALPGFTTAPTPFQVTLKTRQQNINTST